MPLHSPPPPELLPELLPELELPECEPPDEELHPPGSDSSTQDARDTATRVGFNGCGLL
jgi:hypothetical protein